MSHGFAIGSFSKCALALGATALLSVAGCGGGGPDLGTVPAGGTVTLDGTPVEGAVVTFSPDGEGHAAAGITDAAGVYVLTTQVKGDGAVPGSYQVIVSKFEQGDQPMNAEEDLDAAYATADAAGEDVTGNGAANGPAGPKSLLPEKYQSLKTSGLTATVTEDGENKFPLELKK